MCDDISSGALTNERFWCFSKFENISKNDENKKIKNLLCQMNTMKKIWRRIFNSTCLPSGNLVDGLPLDSHNTDARGF